MNSGKNGLGQVFLPGITDLLDNKIFTRPDLGIQPLLEYSESIPATSFGFGGGNTKQSGKENHVYQGLSCRLRSSSGSCGRQPWYQPDGGQRPDHAAYRLRRSSCCEGNG